MEMLPLISFSKDSSPIFCEDGIKYTMMHYVGQTAPILRLFFFLNASRKECLIKTGGQLSAKALFQLYASNFLFFSFWTHEAIL